MVCVHHVLRRTSDDHVGVLGADQRAPPRGAALARNTLCFELSRRAHLIQRVTGERYCGHPRAPAMFGLRAVRRRMYALLLGQRVHYAGGV